MKVRSFYVAPNLPKPLRPLYDIAMNVWFCWNWEAVRLFIRIDEELWEESYQNPIALLGRVSQERLKELEQDDGFVASVERVYKDLQNYLSEKKWFDLHHQEMPDMCVAYFSCEYGLDEGLPVYSGGLGVLSGDHMKSVSDLGIPLVGIGLLYREGYFRQRLNADGWQMEEYPVNDWYNMSVSLVKTEEGEPLTITVEMGEHTVYAQIWLVKVGKANLYLLDTNFGKNGPWAREITNRLYGGDRDMRLRQELLLGIGGYRALKALGKQPTVFHMNEGHSCFLVLERMRDLMVSENLPFETAREIVMASNVFTTHTPVPAGNELFDPELLRKYLSGAIQKLGIDWEQFLDYGRINKGDTKEPFGMTVLALRLSSFCNGVSRLHGEVSRKMWSNLWKKVPNQEIPISHVTNGIHTQSWVSHDLKELFTLYLGPRFTERPWEFDVWNKIDKIPDLELWRTHSRRRERLVFFVRKRLKEQILRRGGHLAELEHADEVLDPHALTIGFARRFATYKRAKLLFTDLERLKSIITNPDFPVQIVIAGKAHPQDIPAKELIKEIIHIVHEEPFRSRIVFLEDYDINVARYLTQGVDVWLNTPRRPLEASGTSGMKAAANGALNLSILDGWWDEGYEPGVGWAIGNRDDFDDEAEQDRVESLILYNCIENEVVPDFYDCDVNNLPRKWITMMKKTMQALGRQFNTHRMLEEYTEQLYIPAHNHGKRFSADHAKVATEFSNWRQTVLREWKGVEIVGVSNINGSIKVGDYIPVEVEVRLGNLKPKEVVVEVIHGRMDSNDELSHDHILKAEYRGDNGHGGHTFSAHVPCAQSGQHGLTVRVRPFNENMIRPFATDCVCWG